MGKDLNLYVWAHRLIFIKQIVIFLIFPVFDSLRAFRRVWEMYGIETLELQTLLILY